MGRIRAPRWALVAVAVAFALSACTPVTNAPSAPNAQARASIVVRPHFAARRAVWRFENFDGPGVTWPGATTDVISPDVISIEYGNATHIFYGAYPPPAWQSERLRHAWIDSTGYHYEDLDGAGVAGGNGRTTDVISNVVSAVVVGNTLHVFYADSSTLSMRHAWFDGSSWHFEDVPDATLDNTGGAAAIDANGVLRLFFEGSAGSDPGGTTLREATLGPDGAWSDIDLDGLGVPLGNGVTNKDVGAYPVAVSDGPRISVFYRGFASGIDGAVRDAYFDGSVWHFEDLTGPDTEDIPTAVFLQAGVVHMFAYDRRFTEVIHFWGSFGNWQLEGIGGHFFPDSDCDETGAGQFPTAVAIGGTIDLFFRGGAEDLCRAVNDGSGWTKTTLDGLGAPAGNGRIPSLHVRAISAVVTSGHIDVFYLNGQLDPLGAGSTLPYTIRHARL